MTVYQEDDLSITEVCLIVSTSSDVIVEVVNHGIVAPINKGDETLVFDQHMLQVIKQAVRLHRDLELNWQGVALALELGAEIDRLRAKNRRLEQRLKRFHGELF